MRGQAFVAAAAMAVALLGLAQPAAAQSYGSYHDEHVARQQECEASRERRTAGGAIIGGLAGAIIGRNAADRGVRGEGTILGAVVGAVAGGAIGRGTAECQDAPEGSYDPHTGRPYDQYGRGDGYYGDDELAGGPYADGYYRDDYGRDCRMRDVMRRDRYGREYRDEAYMCRGRDGVWREE